MDVHLLESDQDLQVEPSFRWKFLQDQHFSQTEHVYLLEELLINSLVTVHQHPSDSHRLRYPEYSKILSPNALKVLVQ